MHKLGNPDAQLCYVQRNGDYFECYFTTQQLDKQWGDDWDDAPYEHNAGTPYGPRRDKGEEFEVCSVLVRLPGYVTPACEVMNSAYSVRDLNRRAGAWLAPEKWFDRERLPNAKVVLGGTTLREFVDVVYAHEGSLVMHVPKDELVFETKHKDDPGLFGRI